MSTGEGNTFQLLQFTLPGMPQVALALPSLQVLEISDLPPVTPLPFTPFFVVGVSQWRDHLITVIDLAALMCGHTTHDNLQRCVIVQVVVDHHIELIAWPILAGVKIIAVPSQLEQTSPIDDIAASGLIFSTVLINDSSLTILNIDQIAQAFAPMAG